MKNTIYAFLIGIAVGVAVIGLVAFKNSNKGLEREQMVVVVSGGVLNYSIKVCTDKTSSIKHVKLKNSDDITGLLQTIQAYEKEGWNVITTQRDISPTDINSWDMYFYLEREKSN